MSLKMLHAITGRTTCQGLNMRTYRTNRPTGVGRIRPKSGSYNAQLKCAIPTESHHSGKESQLWHTSQRPPTSRPEDGLERLLMDDDTLVIERQIEMLNLFVGFEQSNKYSINNTRGDAVGFIAEEPRGFLGTVSRQLFATHRPFSALIMDIYGTPILWIRRPFSWINSRMFIQRLKDFHDYTPQGEPVLDTFGEVQQIWHPWRRRYDIFMRDDPKRVLSLASDPQPEPDISTFSQIARVDSGFLAWDFRLCDANGKGIARISRAFRGFGREIFTDTGQYSVRFGHTENMPILPQSQAKNVELGLEERALCLALAVNIDFDYFSRHSHTEGGGLFHSSSWE